MSSGARAARPVSRLLPAMLAACLYAPDRAHPHGAILQTQPAPGITVQAFYDDGTEMADAQIVIYAPHDPVRPWRTGVADARGRLSFVPDSAISGRWTVQARQAGHGAMAYFTTNDDSASVIALSSQTGITPLQRAIMAACVIWGMIGTALFFHRRRTP